MKSLPTTTVLNVDFVNTTSETLLDEYRAGVVFPLNIDTLVTLQHDREFYDACAAADYRVMDSQVLYFAAKLSGRPFKAKISGSDFFPLFCEYHKHDGDVGIFLLGGLNAVASTARRKINEKAGRELVVGAVSPSLGFETNGDENRAIIRMIEESGANVLVVGVGAPKQEKWIMRHRSELPGIRMYVAVGATLDFIAGAQIRAPLWMQQSGFEWLYRLLRDPGRLFRRYLIRDLSFFYYFTRDVIGVYKNPFKA